MRCPMQDGQNAELLLAYCTRKLDPAARAAFERHIQSCPDCQTFSEQQKLVWEALEAWEALPVSSDFDERLYRRISELEAARTAGLRGWLAGMLQPLRAVWPVAAASMVALAVLLLRAPVAPPPEADTAELVEIERAEQTLEDLQMLRTLHLMARAEAPAAQPM